jgi:hypothetical protein
LTLSFLFDGRILKFQGAHYVLFISYSTFQIWLSLFSSYSASSIDLCDRGGSKNRIVSLSTIVWNQACLFLLSLRGLFCEILNLLALSCRVVCDILSRGFSQDVKAIIRRIRNQFPSKIRYPISKVSYSRADKVGWERKCAEIE